MKKLIGLILVFMVAFTSQAEIPNGAGNENVVYDVGYDLPTAQAVIDNTFAEVNPSPNVTTIVVNYTSEGGLEIAKIIQNSVVQNYSDVDNDLTRYAIITDLDSLVIKNRNYKDSKTEWYNSSPNPTSPTSDERIKTNVGKYNS